MMSLPPPPTAPPDPVQDQSLPALPLPVELITRIVFFGIQGRTSDQRRDDLKSLRLVSRDFATLAAPFLFEKLYVSRNPFDLQVLQQVSQNPFIANCIKTLVYDGSIYNSGCLEWGDDCTHPDFARVHSLECWECWACKTAMNFKGLEQNPDLLRHFKNCKILDEHFFGCRNLDGSHMMGHLKLYQQRFKDQSRVTSKGLDQQILKESLPLMPRIDKFVFKSWVAERWNFKPRLFQDEKLPSKLLRTGVPPCKEVTVDMINNSSQVIEILNSINISANLITTLEINWVSRHVLDFLADDREILNKLCAGISGLKDLKVVMKTDMRWRDNENGIETGEDLIMRSSFATGVLGELIGSAPSLRRLHLNLSRHWPPQRRGGTDGWELGLPLSTYLGKDWFKNSPGLENVYLGSFDVTQDEMVKFFKSHRSLKKVFLDHMVLRTGQWDFVGLVATRLLPQWRKLGCHQLVQKDEVEELKLTTTLSEMLEGDTENWESDRGTFPVGTGQIHLTQCPRNQWCHTHSHWNN